MTKIKTVTFVNTYPGGFYEKLVRHRGTVLFPFRLKSILFGRFSPPLNARLSEPGPYCQKQYWSACLCILLLMAYVGLCAAVVWFSAG
ncbi:hypothetical protein BANRA_05410 [Escherichia coli]|nr:hypothetical protein BANRA_05410 [Escherichia coli]